MTEPGRLRLIIEIVPNEDRPDGYPAGVIVVTEAFAPGDVPDAVGATWVGICTAVNGYMRSRGAENFDCLAPYIEGENRTVQ